MRFRWFFGGTFFGMMFGAALAAVAFLSVVAVVAFSLGIRPDNVHAWRSSQRKIAIVYMLQTEGDQASKEGHLAITEFLMVAEKCLEVDGANGERSSLHGLRHVMQNAIKEAMFRSMLKQKLRQQLKTPPSPPAKPTPDIDPILAPSPSDRRF